MKMPPVNDVGSKFQSKTLLSLAQIKRCINDFICLVIFSWLIEINASPSLTASGKDDYDLKYGVLNDVLNVLDLENR
jgi:hypothetical protein